MEKKRTTDNTQANKRIAKNTLVVYGQLVLRMILGLYTSRLALEALGVSDFGLNSVVGGIVALFTFVYSTLSDTTIRFINVERGKADGDLNRMFNVCNVLHIAMAILLFILLEVCGVYYIHNFLNVMPGKEDDAMFVFQVSAIVCCIGIVNVPFSSLFNATEKFLFTAVVAISVKVVQLILLFWLLTYEGSRIKAFALIESLSTLTSFIVYHYYCYRKWPDVIKWKFVRRWRIYKEALLYSFYSLLSSLAYMSRSQGSLLLINYFFGTVVNGAFAVAKTIERNILPFANNIKNAATPQITQNYSSGDMDRVFFLTSRIGKYCLFMMMLGFFPLWAELDFILHLWLIKVPSGALVFCQMILLMVFVAVSDGGISQVVNASGKVSRFKTIYSFMTISSIPIGFFALKLGSPAYIVLVIFLVADSLWRIVQLWMMSNILHFPVLNYCKEAYLPIVKACIPVVLCLNLTSRIQNNSTIWHISHIAIILFLTALAVFTLGLQKSERKKVINLIIHRTKLN